MPRVDENKLRERVHELDRLNPYQTFPRTSADGWMPRALSSTTVRRDPGHTIGLIKIAEQIVPVGPSERPTSRRGC